MTFQEGSASPALEFHSVIAINKTQTVCWVCPRKNHHDISMFIYRNGCWYKEKDYPKNPHRLIQLVCSQDESIIIATFTTGYILWHANVVSDGIGKKKQTKHIAVFEYKYLVNQILYLPYSTQTTIWFKEYRNKNEQVQ